MTAQFGRNMERVVIMRLANFYSQSPLIEAPEIPLEAVLIGGWAAHHSSNGDAE